MMKNLKHQDDVTLLKKWSNLELRLHTKFSETREAVHEALCGKF